MDSLDAELRVREARSDEVETLHGIIRRAFSEYEGRLDPPTGAQRDTPDSIRDKLAAGGALICEIGGAVAGCVLYELRGDHLYIGRLAVLPEYRRHGVGSALMDAAEQRARDLGFHRVRLGVRLVLDNLRKYYAARGYVPIALHTHAGYTEPTAVVMEKTFNQT